MTGFELAKKVNFVLRNEDLKEIPPQQIYRYFDQKLIRFELVDGKKRVSEEDANAWIQKYVAKRIAKANS